jgi:hypothetical protein
MDCHRLFSENIECLKVGNNDQATGLCPFHNDKKPSFSVCLNQDSEKYGLWNCHACNESGNAYQFAKRLGIDPTPYQSYKKAEKTYKQTEIETEARRYNEYLTANFDELKASGKIPAFWTLKAVKNTFNGYDKRRDILVFSHCDQSGRPINLKYHNNFQTGQSQNKLFPANLISKYDKNSFLVFCEGEKDCVSLLSKGIPAVTVTAGARSIPKDLTPLEGFNRIFIVYDNDSAGVEGSQSLADRLKYLYPSMAVFIHFWDSRRPEGFDITDFFLEGGDFINILGNSEPHKFSSGNWVKLYRDWFIPEFYKNPDLGLLFFHLLNIAGYKAQSVKIESGKSIFLGRGQVIIGKKRLAKALNSNPSTILYRLRHLQEIGLIKIESHKQFSIITICNYDN